MAVIKVIEIMSSSKESWEDATQAGIKKVSDSIHDIKSAYIRDQSVTVGSDGKIEEYRVSLKISFQVN